jgi:polysaccharide chain length determinant protein (PEP-CTERM system associated)
MLPGKKYTPEDVLAILRRRIWWLLVPFAVVSAAACVAAQMMPDLYRSDTLILVVPQRVPESYVRSTITTRIEDRLQSISQQILSRTRLERIIQDFNLYPDERRTGITEDIVQRMRTQHIDIRVQKGDAFSVSYIGSDPKTVMQVTDRLASLFIEESLRDRQVLAEGTNQFLESQLEDARRRLIEHEKKLEAFRQRYSGELPSQFEANLKALDSIQMRMQSVLQQIDRDQDRRIALQRQLGDLEAQAERPETAAQATSPSATGSEQPTGTTNDQLQAQRMALEAARLRLKPEHPDIQGLQRAIRDLEARAEAEQLQVPVSVARAPRSPAEMARERRIREITDEIERIDTSVAEVRKEEASLRVSGAGYQARANAAPTRESELTELMRDYTPLQALYSSLLTKKEDARISANLEQRQVGEQFRLLDPARFPERPFSPDRQQSAFYGVVAGLSIGVMLVGLLEYRDKSFKTDEEITSVLALPVLAVVPRMRSDADRRVEFKRGLFLNIGLGTAVICCLAVLAYTYLR